MKTHRKRRRLRRPGAIALSLLFAALAIGVLTVSPDRLSGASSRIEQAWAEQVWAAPQIAWGQPSSR